MNRLFLTAAAIPVLMAAAPASAEYQSRFDAQTDARISQLQTRLRAGIEQGTINRREARPLREQLRQLTLVERQYRSGGFSQRERADLQQRTRALRQQIRLADGGGYDRQERRVGYTNDGYYGQGGPYEESDWVVDANAQSRGGISGLLGSILGRGGTLRVGQRATANLYGVPSEYRGQFRDNSNVYYRSDGSRIYEIDARNHTIVQVYTRND